MYTKKVMDCSGAQITAMVVGQIQHICVEEGYAKGYDKRYDHDSFMMLVPAMQDLINGEAGQTAIATVKIERFRLKVNCIIFLSQFSFLIV